mgnify:CR=1 FL=1
MSSSQRPIQKQTDLRVYYGYGAFERTKQGVLIYSSAVFEEELDRLLSKYGFVRWASGHDPEGQVRDIAYDHGV